jgi:hypothetical protein
MKIIRIGKPSKKDGKVRVRMDLSIDPNRQVKLLSAVGECLTPKERKQFDRQAAKKKK